MEPVTLKIISNWELLLINRQNENEFRRKYPRCPCNAVKNHLHSMTQISCEIYVCFKVHFLSSCTFNNLENKKLSRGNKTSCNLCFLRIKIWIIWILSNLCNRKFTVQSYKFLTWVKLKKSPTESMCRSPRQGVNSGMTINCKNI